MCLSSLRRLTFTFLACAVSCLGSAAIAQSVSNPYGEPESSRPRPKADLLPAEPRKPALAPMEGRIPAPGDNARAVPQAELEAYRATPYSPGAASDPPYNAPPQAGPAPPASGITSEPLRDIESADLSPVTPNGGTSEISDELWRGLTEAQIEALFAELEIPPQSPAVHLLWRRLITTGAGANAGGGNSDRFTALRIEALDRSGLVAEAREAAERAYASGTQQGLLLKFVLARSDIANGDWKRGCENAKAVAGAQEDLPKLMKAEAIVMTGYCVAAAGNTQGAGTAADLAREFGMTDSAGLDGLDAISAGVRPGAPAAKSISLLDFRILELAGASIDSNFVARAAPNLAAYLANDTAREPSLRLAAGETAARLNAISPQELGEIYRAQPRTAPAETLVSDAAAGEVDPALRRALLAEAALSERTPQKKARYIRAFLDDARRAGLYWPGLIIMSGPVSGVTPAPEVGWFSETAIETLIVAGRYDQVRAWVDFAQTLDRPAGDLRSWLALADIADPAAGAERSGNLAPVERLAVDGRFDPVLLHRLATALDALGTHIPIPLWDAAGRTAQPNQGHLPKTGVLAELQEASKKKEFGHTVLLAMKTLGPDGAEGAHLIALGDAIRALKRAGLEGDARRLAFEALFAGWPRALSN